MKKIDLENLSKENKKKIIDGKLVADQIKHDLKRKVQGGVNKNLAAILVGNNKESKTYIKLKKKFAKDIGINFFDYFLDEDSTQEEVEECLNFLANDFEIDGILFQLPLPKKFNTQKILNYIPPEKDVDGFLKNTLYKPVLLKAVFKVIQEMNLNLDNKNITLIYNSDIFANKVEENFTEKYKNINFKKILFNKNNILKIKKETKKSDLIISCVGEKEFIKKDFIKKDSSIIDIGVSHENNEIFGDVDFFEIIEKVKFITPPIKGIGPITVAMLFENLIDFK
ncbi:bifunctional 5,10-methylenetetrahydrofolate dehydrogenase/5,10-methenyltetrahydrofolate cyclohydrolase [Patescibacteria group bacterium]|nr:bifunctional 5,10-methylenetetrahydrofolate dehydrogenase/5,10-methenyltetrahydrofolate cyclohydrolase [Patescibacteria group bacterium]